MLACGEAVHGITICNYQDLETVLAGSNARRQRVLKGRLPGMLVRERLTAKPDHLLRSSPGSQ